MSIPMIHVKVPHSSHDGSLIDPTNFAYDMGVKRWKHKLDIARETIESYSKAIVTKENLIQIGVPVLQQTGFVTHDVDRALLVRKTEAATEVAGDTVEATVQAPEASDEPVGDTVKGKRGRQSKYPYKTMQIGESFEIDADAVGITLNHSLLSDRGFEIKVVNRRFVVTRTR